MRLCCDAEAQHKGDVAKCSLGQRSHFGGCSFVPKYWSGGFHLQIGFSLNLQASQVTSFAKTNTFYLTPLRMQQKNMTLFLKLHSFMGFLLFNSRSRMFYLSCRYINSKI